ncbi:hypothetical protein MLD52_21045, partial [Puniceicoccaceae bacterium K14]|nr:hypothetical protein [Puniceicoccaceae bacterium K14]
FGNFTFSGFLVCSCFSVVAETMSCQSATCKTLSAIWIHFYETGEFNALLYVSKKEDANIHSSHLVDGEDEEAKI